MNQITAADPSLVSTASSTSEYDSLLCELEEEGVLDGELEEESDLDEDDLLDMEEEGDDAHYSWLEVYYVNGALYSKKP